MDYIGTDVGEQKEKGEVQAIFSIDHNGKGSYSQLRTTLRLAL